MAVDKIMVAKNLNYAFTHSSYLAGTVGAYLEISKKNVSTPTWGGLIQITPTNGGQAALYGAYINSAGTVFLSPIVTDSNSGYSITTGTNKIKIECTVRVAAYYVTTYAPKTETTDIQIYRSDTGDIT